MEEEGKKQSSFGRGFSDVIFGRLTTNGKPAISTDQLLVTSGVAVGSFFLGRNVIGPKLPIVSSKTQENTNA